MNGNKGSSRYLIAAIIWTVIAAVALALLLIAEGAMFGKLCGMVLICLCIVGQWLRYFKSR